MLLVQPSRRNMKLTRESSNDNQLKSGVEGTLRHLRFSRRTVVDVLQVQVRALRFRMRPMVIV